MKLAEVTWPEAARLDRNKTLVVAPIAACEQHSRHLPTFTDAILCGAVADGLEKELADQILLLPVQWLGASDHHLPFGATLTASVDRHIDLICEIARSVLHDGYRKLLVLNGHGGNIDTMHVALRRLQPEFPDCLLTGASYWELAAQEIAAIAKGPRKDMGHACELETSMMLHLRPDLVRFSEAKDDHQPLPESLRGLYWAHDFSQRTRQGCVGYPQSASAETGRALLEASIARVVEVCRTLLTTSITPGRQAKNRGDGHFGFRP
jgi:creatinine amidohydrolase